MHKKILYLLILVILFTGCDKKNVTTKVCTFEQEGLPNQTFTISATNNVVDKLDVKATYNNQLLGIEDFKQLSEDEKNTMMDGILSTLGLDSYHYDGIDINYSFDDNLNIFIKVDLKYAKANILKKLGIEMSEFKAEKMEDVTQNLSSKGAVCE